MAKSKYYVVWSGRNPGVYTTWADCEREVKGQKGARFKSFDNRTAAEQAFAAGPAKYTPKPGAKKPGRKAGEPLDLGKFRDIDPISWCVDAACSGNPGKMEYRGVDTLTEQQLFIRKFEEGTNNIGEFLGIVHALALLVKKGDKRTVYSDSKIAINWVLRDKRCKTKLEPNAKNKALFEWVAKAELWLKNNRFPNEIKKWNTAKWGEIPADFGRK